MTKGHDLEVCCHGDIIGHDCDLFLGHCLMPCILCTHSYLTINVALNNKSSFMKVHVL